MISPGPGPPRLHLLPPPGIARHIGNPPGLPQKPIPACRSRHLSSARLHCPFQAVRFTSDSSQDKGRSLRVSLRKIASFSQSTLQIHTLAELRGFHLSHMPLGQGGGPALLMFLPLLASGARTHTHSLRLKDQPRRLPCQNISLVRRNQVKTIIKRSAQAHFLKTRLFGLIATCSS